MGIKKAAAGHLAATLVVALSACGRGEAGVLEVSVHAIAAADAGSGAIEYWLMNTGSATAVYNLCYGTAERWVDDRWMQWSTDPRYCPSSGDLLAPGAKSAHWLRSLASDDCSAGPYRIRIGVHDWEGDAEAVFTSDPVLLTCPPTEE